MEARLEPKYYFKTLDDRIKILFKGKVWEALKRKEEFEYERKVLGKVKRSKIRNSYVGKGTVVRPYSVIEDSYVGENCVIGPHAYVRKGCIILDEVQIGRAEVKGSILMKGVKAHHHSYVGDSILGERVNVAAGFITANLRFDGKDVKVEGHETGLRKFGAILGDEVKTGVNAVTLPGTLVGPESWIYPLTIVGGFHPRGSKITPGGSAHMKETLVYAMPKSPITMRKKRGRSPKGT